VLGSVGATNAAVLVQGITNAPPFWNLTNWLAAATTAPGSNAIPIAVWHGTNGTQTNLTVFMPPSNPERFLYDLNGNLTNDGWRAYTWDEENRLISVESVSSVVKLRSKYIYDGIGRRIERIDYSQWNGADCPSTNVTRFVWDGWLLLTELGAKNAVQAYNTWGLDLSKSLQGAGGIGGLLARTESGTSYLYAYDGNGNACDVLNTNGVLVAPL